MSAKTSSPMAQLLRNSRFFSLPRPLPLPTVDLMGHAGSDARPETATLPYPIQQALVTTPQALARGDWGLKRNLPLRTTTRTSTPLVRLNAMDTREHITDFSPASDLTLNLKKIQELNLSVTVAAPRVRKSQRGQRSGVFESEVDSTDPTQDTVGRTRWKHKGPWVAGMTQGDFDAYVQKELAGRREEFALYLRDYVRRQLQIQRAASDRHEGLQANPAYEPTEPEIDAYTRKMRNEFTLISELSRLIEKFLDLPAAPAGNSLSVISALGYEDNKAMYETGPPKTHPSAGLTYAKTDAYLDNHPLFGPQRDRAPVEARILSRQQNGFQARGNGTSGKIGIAGVVANEPAGREKLRSNPSTPNVDNPWELEDKKAASIGVGTPGGNRIWVQPTSLEINSRGRVVIKTAHSKPTIVGIKTGELAAPSTIAPPSRTPLGRLSTYDSMPTSDAFSTRPKASGYGINVRDGTSALVSDMRKTLRKKT